MKAQNPIIGQTIKSFANVSFKSKYHSNLVCQKNINTKSQLNINCQRTSNCFKESSIIATAIKEQCNYWNGFDSFKRVLQQKLVKGIFDSPKLVFIDGSMLDISQLLCSTFTYTPVTIISSSGNINKNVTIQYKTPVDTWNTKRNGNLILLYIQRNHDNTFNIETAHTSFFSSQSQYTFIHKFNTWDTSKVCYVYIFAEFATSHGAGKKLTAWSKATISGTPTPPHGTITYNSNHNWTVPTGVTSVAVEIQSTNGDDGEDYGVYFAGGAGVKISGTLTVVAGQILQCHFNDFTGGIGNEYPGDPSYYGGNGADATSIFISSYIAIAGGGSGGGPHVLGDNGKLSATGTSGSNGGDGDINVGGGGGGGGYSGGNGGSDMIASVGGGSLIPSGWSAQNVSNNTAYIKLTW